MTRYYVGDRLVLGEHDGKPLAACRIEAVRPDGSRITRDWGKGPRRLTLDQSGSWSWRLYIREETRTLVEEGDIEVLPAPSAPGALNRLLQRITHLRRD
jgi:hypothetical protein